MSVEIPMRDHSLTWRTSIIWRLLLWPMIKIWTREAVRGYPRGNAITLTWLICGHELPSLISYLPLHTDLILPKDSNPPAVVRDMILLHPGWDNSCRLLSVTPLNDPRGRNDSRRRKEDPTGSLTGVNSPLPHKWRRAIHVIDPQAVNLYEIFQLPVRHICYFMSSLSPS